MITRQPTNQMITALQNVTLTCKAKGFEVEYEWKRQNGIVTGSRITGRRQSSLTISRATPSDEDQYYCVAMIEGGYVFSNNVTLTVNGKVYLDVFIILLHFVGTNRRTQQFYNYHNVSRRYIVIKHT